MKVSSPSCSPIRCTGASSSTALSRARWIAEGLAPGKRSLSMVPPSHEAQPTLFERDEALLAGAHDHVVEHLAIQELARLHRLGGDPHVFWRRSGIARRMVMDDDH